MTSISLACFDWFASVWSIPPRSAYTPALIDLLKTVNGKIAALGIKNNNPTVSRR